jgi:FKBP-type peptidyl-prolyl cis-trans isomerase SlyD
MTVSSGKEVSIEYTLRLEDKTVVDSNVGGEPLTYTQGAQQIISGLESEVEGMAVGESKAVTVPPERGYGVMDAAAFREVANEHIPEAARVLGAKLQGRDSRGQSVYARVAQVKENSVVLDFNHPLAGKTLYFEVKVLDIQDAPAE